MIRSLILLALSVPAWAGDPAQYNPVQSAACPVVQHSVWVWFGVGGSAERRSVCVAMPEPPVPTQLDRIEQMLRAICQRQAIGQPTAKYAAACPAEPKP